MMLQSEIVESKNRSDCLESYNATISHEFRTPLSTALMFLESLLRQLQDEQLLKLCKMMQCQLSFLLSLVHDLLDLKMEHETHGITTKLQNFKPSQLFDFIYEMFAQLATQTDL